MTKRPRDALVRIILGILLATGCASRTTPAPRAAVPDFVDVTLVDADGHELEMPTAFGDFSGRAHRNSAAGTPTAGANASRLEGAMTAEGSIPFPTEWWHFDGPGWEAYPLSDDPVGPEQKNGSSGSRVGRKWCDWHWEVAPHKRLSSSSGAETLA